METYIHCFQAQEKLGKTTDASCHDGSVRIKFIHNDADVEYGVGEMFVNSDGTIWIYS